MPFARRFDPPATEADRVAARASASAIRASLVDKAAAGERATIHIDMSRPRRGVWLHTWENLPGLSLDIGRRMYSHTLLPGWEYSVREFRTEMLDDLDLLAETGERPKVATANKVPV